MGEDVKALHDLARRYWADLAETEYLPDDILEQIERTVPSHFPDVEDLRAYLLGLEWGAGYHKIECMLTPEGVTNLTAMDDMARSSNRVESLTYDHDAKEMARGVAELQARRDELLLMFRQQIRSLTSADLLSVPHILVSIYLTKYLYWNSEHLAPLLGPRLLRS